MSTYTSITTVVSGCERDKIDDKTTNHARIVLDRLRVRDLLKPEIPDLVSGPTSREIDVARLTVPHARKRIAETEIRVDEWETSFRESEGGASSDGA